MAELPKGEAAALVASAAEASEPLSGPGLLAPRAVTTGLALVDQFVGPFAPATTTLIDTAHPFGHDLVHLLALRSIVEFDRPVVWIDGGTTLNPYALSALCRRQRLAPREILSQIQIARAFTAYQLVTLIEDDLERVVEEAEASAVFVTAFPDLFLDPDMAWPEAWTLLRGCTETLRRLTTSAQLITVVSNLGLAKLLTHRVLQRHLYEEFADSVLRIEPARQGLRVRLPRKENRMLPYWPTPPQQTTLEEYETGGELPSAALCPPSA